MKQPNRPAGRAVWPVSWFLSSEPPTSRRVANPITTHLAVRSPPLRDASKAEAAAKAARRTPARFAHLTYRAVHYHSGCQASPSSSTSAIERHTVIMEESSVKAAAVQRLMAAKAESGKSFSDVAAETGLTNVYVAQLLRRQAQLKPETAPKLRAALPALTDDLVDLMMQPPFRSYHPEIVHEPAVYRSGFSDLLPLFPLISVICDGDRVRRLSSLAIASRNTVSYLSPSICTVDQSFTLPTAAWY